MEYSAAVLRNKGVQVDVAVLAPREDGARPEALVDGDGNPKIEKRWVRFDANCIADIEDAFGNLAEFETATKTTPFRAIRQALAIVWGVSPQESGAMMLDGRIGDYSTAVGVALALANGVDPTQAGRLLKIGVTTERRQTARRDKMLEEAMAEAEAEEDEDDEQTADSPGTTGSEVGSPEVSSEEAETSTPSGG